MRSAILALVCSFVFAPLMSAHEGHDHKVMGTVAAVNETRLDVKVADDKTSEVTLDGKTKILRGTSTAKVTDIRSGERIVVTATETKDSRGRVILLAKEVLLGE